MSGHHSGVRSPGRECSLQRAFVNVGGKTQLGTKVQRPIQDAKTTDVRRWQTKPPMIRCRQAQPFTGHLSVCGQTGVSVNDAFGCTGRTARGNDECVIGLQRNETSCRW